MRIRSASSQEDVDRLNAAGTVVFTPQPPKAEPTFNPANTRWFVTMDEARRPVRVHRLLGGTMPQLFEVQGREWDIYDAAQRAEFRADMDQGLVIEVDEATATLATLDLIGGSMR